MLVCKNQKGVPTAAAVIGAVMCRGQAGYGFGPTYCHGRRKKKKERQREKNGKEGVWVGSVPRRPASSPTQPADLTTSSSTSSSYYYNSSSFEKPTLLPPIPAHPPPPLLHLSWLSTSSCPSSFLLSFIIRPLLMKTTAPRSSGQTPSRPSASHRENESSRGYSSLTWQLED
ncbi:uncharacterized protein [Palaemon carinicauda]|uniref:uncharacterized protein n=1 Tax=Palaemon carinicauda TaxID=392227 RepID=UPI0035B6939F